MTTAPRLGLVCISEILKDKKIAFQTMTRKRFNELDRTKAIAELSSKILNNARVTGQVIVHCASVGISHYRVSSSLFPLITDETLNLSYTDLPDLDSIRAVLAFAGNHARKVNVTLSSHPDQFNVLASYRQDVVDKTIKELNHQAWVLDQMDCIQDYSSPMCLHVNKSPDFDVETISEYVDRFMANLNKCDAGVRNRIVVENEDNGYWNCENLYNAFGKLLPCVYDNLHDSINPSPIYENVEDAVSSQTAEDYKYIDIFKSTWTQFGHYTPVMHWSEGINGSKSHTDYFTKNFNMIAKHTDCIWEAEVKAKDKAIIKVLTEQFRR